MSESQSELTAVPGKPGWLRSPVIDDHEKLGEAREITVHAHDLRKHHVFTGPMPKDDAAAPPGWEDAQREKFTKFQSHWMSPVELREMMERVSFPYEPYRVFVAPREEAAEVIRHFRVGSHDEDDETYPDAVAAKVVAIDRIAAVSIHDLSPAHVSLVFLDPISIEVARELGALFPFLNVTEDVSFKDAFIGMESYLSEMEEDSGEDFLAERFFRDQEILLWWD